MKPIVHCGWPNHSPYGRKAPRCIHPMKPVITRSFFIRTNNIIHITFSTVWACRAHIASGPPPYMLSSGAARLPRQHVPVEAEELARVRGRDGPQDAHDPVDALARLHHRAGAAHVCPSRQPRRAGRKSTTGAPVFTQPGSMHITVKFGFALLCLYVCASRQYARERWGRGHARAC